VNRPGCVLHVSAEFPDSLNCGRNSPVIARLVAALAEQMPQVVVSINRTSDPRRACVVEEAPNHLAVRYFALPYGIGHGFFMRQLGATLADWLQRRAIRPTLIVGHKFTVEGLLAGHLAEVAGCDYALGFMSTTDDKLWRALPWCRPGLRRLAAGAVAWVFPTPATERRFVPRLPAAPRWSRVIPYISGIPERPPALHLVADSRALLTVFNFQNLRYKNFERLVSAVLQVRAQGLLVTLDVAGHGHPAEVARVHAVIERLGATAAVRCIGHVDAVDMPCTMARYGAMVLPSRPESFGLVYLEAIAAGVPVMSSSGFALDGFFRDGYPGVKVDPGSVASIAAGIRELVESRPRFAAAFDHIGPEWRRFTRSHIQASFMDIVSGVRHAH
jgi:glycosyltransferase involved in cell wall biosynthesis